MLTFAINPDTRAALKEIELKCPYCMTKFDNSTYNKCNICGCEIDNQIPYTKISIKEQSYYNMIKTRDFIINFLENPDQSNDAFCIINTDSVKEQVMASSYLATYFAGHSLQIVPYLNLLNGIYPSNKIPDFVYTYDQVEKRGFTKPMPNNNIIICICIEGEEKYEVYKYIRYKAITELFRMDIRPKIIDVGCTGF